MVDDPTRGDAIKPVELPGFGRVEDSRLKRIRITHPTLPLERTFCTNCGAPFGWVSTESYNYIEVGEVVVFCNQCEYDMNSKLGPIPLRVAAPDHATDIPPLRRGSLPSILEG